MKELNRYRRRGPERTTQMLTHALQAEGVQDQTLLDIGGGLGSIEHELLPSGMERATNVDASLAYIQAAQSEAQRRGLADRIRFTHGDFVDLAPEIAPAGVVTLDRVICCYHDMERLVDLSAARAERLLGGVYPTRQVEALIQHHGLKRRFYRRTMMWQVAVYSR